MYRRTNKDQLSFKDFCLRLDSKLSSNNRWVIMEKLIPWDEMEDDYAAKKVVCINSPPADSVPRPAALNKVV